MGLGPAHGQGLLGVFRPANDLKTALRQSVGNAENSAPIKPDFKSGKQRHRPTWAQVSCRGADGKYSEGMRPAGPANRNSQEN
jgi:hypothetical protein